MKLRKISQVDYSRFHQLLCTDLRLTSPRPITSDQTVNSVARGRLLESCFKKLAPKGDSTDADNAALKKFLAVNAAIPEEFSFTSDGPMDHILYDEWRAIITQVVMDMHERVPLDIVFLAENGDVGPGASLGANSSSFFTKMFDGPLTYSASNKHLVRYFRTAVALMGGSWPVAERQRSTKFGEMEVPGNQLFFAKKNAEISRTCCTEPSLEMFFQKAIGKWIELCLERYFGISLATAQFANRDLALHGSLDGKTGTIDMVSASDMISWALCRKDLPPCLTAWLRMTRCERTVLPDGSMLRLGMVSTMGNGFTFPLQTLIFACAVRAVYRCMGIPCGVSGTNYGVFGDDIIVDVRAYNAVMRLLRGLGFCPNEGKSFGNGSFRESCGIDAFKGEDVRGVYIQTLETTHDVCSAYNRLTKWCARHGEVLYLSRVFLLDLLDNKTPVIPISEDDSGGIKVPNRAIEKHHKVRRGMYGEHHFRKLAYEPRRQYVPEDSEEAQSLGYGDYNPLGQVIAFLRGNIRFPTHPVGSEDRGRGFIALRAPVSESRDVTRWRKVRATVPFWDYVSPSCGLTDSQFQEWKILVELTLN